MVDMVAAPLPAYPLVLVNPALVDLPPALIRALATPLAKAPLAKAPLAKAPLAATPLAKALLAAETLLAAMAAAVLAVATLVAVNHRRGLQSVGIWVAPLEVQALIAYLISRSAFRKAMVQ
jgi:hypothetical protein